MEKAWQVRPSDLDGSFVLALCALLSFPDEKRVLETSSTAISSRTTCFHESPSREK